MPAKIQFNSSPTTTFNDLDDNEWFVYNKQLYFKMYNDLPGKFPDFDNNPRYNAICFSDEGPLLEETFNGFENVKHVDVKIIVGDNES